MVGRKERLHAHCAQVSTSRPFPLAFFCALDLVLTLSVALSPITSRCWIADGSFILDILFSFTSFSSHHHCRRLPIVLFSVFIIIFPVISSSLFIYTFYLSFLLSPFAIVECIRFGLNCCGNSDDRESKMKKERNRMYVQTRLIDVIVFVRECERVRAASKCMAKYRHLIAVRLPWMWVLLLIEKKKRNVDTTITFNLTLASFIVRYRFVCCHWRLLADCCRSVWMRDVFAQLMQAKESAKKLKAKHHIHSPTSAPSYPLSQTCMNVSANRFTYTQ